MSEDREGSPKPVGDPLPLLKRLLFGAFAGAFIIALEFGGLFGIPPSSLWEIVLAILVAGCAFGMVIAVVVPWVGPEERLKGCCLFAIAGGTAGGVAWLIAQPDTSILVAVGANALLAFFYPLAEDLFS